MLIQELLQVVYSIAGRMFIFQQENAATHPAHNTVEFLCHEDTPFINAWLVISDLQYITRICGYAASFIPSINVGC